jgi:hypothetical protein
MLTCLQLRDARDSALGGGEKTQAQGLVELFRHGSLGTRALARRARTCAVFDARGVVDHEESVFLATTADTVSRK